MPFEIKSVNWMFYAILLANQKRCCIFCCFVTSVLIACCVFSRRFYYIDWQFIAENCFFLFRYNVKKFPRLNIVYMLD